MASNESSLTRRQLGGIGAAAVTLAAMGGIQAAVNTAAAQTAGTIKVGVLHSLSDAHGDQ